ncbi:MAG: 3-oxoacyl-[acyl-carrier-protein] reductase [Candidatus Sumerlaeia bacterium]|nr:3-oxoacyl-[acyl-carrier-protein] reductase [Candidatus Sumerlaeia bacterium]
MGQLDGKVAIVTGGGRGIGKAIALRLAGEGAAVLVNSATEKSCGAVAEEIKAAGGKALAVAGDVSEAEVAKAVVEAATKELGGLDILVNNAGITRDALLMRLKEEQWDEVMRVNLKSAFLLSQAAIRPMMKSRWGRIINITSIVGIIGNPGQTNYAASKAAMIGFTKSLAKEVASRNILVNAIAPGFIETSMTDELNAEWKEKLMGEIPQARFGHVDDIAGPVLFLCSDAANYITGTTLEVTGGMGM